MTVEPILTGMIRDGISVSLPLESIVSIAPFAFKNAIISDHMQKGKPFFVPSVRRRFSLSLRIPQGVQIWIAALRSREYASRGIIKTLYYKAKAGKQLRYYVFTYAIGYVVLQVLSIRWLKVPKGLIGFPWFDQNPAWDSGAKKLWPSNGLNIVWPPDKYLSDDTLDGFCDRWKMLEFRRHFTIRFQEN